MNRSPRSQRMKQLLSLFAIGALFACGGGGAPGDSNTSQNPATTIPSVKNNAPIADAGSTQSVMTGIEVVLDGRASSDPDSDPLNYHWTLTSRPSGSGAVLSSRTLVQPRFIPDLGGEYVVSLVVDDGKLNSANTAKVSIKATFGNSNPVANPGLDQSVIVGAIVTLDGSASSDPNGDPLTYTWTLTSKPTGSSATLSSPATPRPALTADLPGKYIATLAVNDGKSNSASTSITITASLANAPPIANAGPGQNVVLGTSVTLDGGASTDVNGDALNYLWSLTSKPTGSIATISSSASQKTAFLPDVVGTYVASLVVNDGKLSSEPSTVVIAVTRANAAPIANAGVAQRVVTGDLVTLDGTASTDANGDPLNFAWSLTSVPVGSVAAISNTAVAKPAFSTDLAGTYIASLVVSDGNASSATSTVVIEAISDLSRFFSTAFGSSGTLVDGAWPVGSQFTFRITNGSNEKFALTRFEFQNDGVALILATSASILSDGELVPGESITLTATLAQTTVPKQLRSIYYLKLERTGQEFAITKDW